MNGDCRRDTIRRADEESALHMGATNLCRVIGYNASGIRTDIVETKLSLACMRRLMIFLRQESRD